MKHTDTSTMSREELIAELELSRSQCFALEQAVNKMAYNKQLLGLKFKNMLHLTQSGGLFEQDEEHNCDKNVSNTTQAEELANDVTQIRDTLTRISIQDVAEHIENKQELKEKILKLQAQKDKEKAERRSKEAEPKKKRSTTMVYKVKKR